MSQALIGPSSYGEVTSVPGMEDVMTWTTEAKWIVAHSAFTTLLVLAWAYIPA
jgi:hypothetical protein